MVTESKGEENTYLFAHCILNFNLILLIFYLNSKVSIRSQKKIRIRLFSGRILNPGQRRALNSLVCRQYRPGDGQAYHRFSSQTYSPCVGICNTTISCTILDAEIISTTYLCSHCFHQILCPSQVQHKHPHIKVL